MWSNILVIIYKKSREWFVNKQVQMTYMCETTVYDTLYILFNF